MRIKIFKNNYTMTKLIYRVVSIIALVVMFTTTAAAQDNAAARKVTTAMKEQLDLNDMQFKQVFIVNGDFITKSLENKAASKTNVEKAKKLQQLDKEWDTKLKSVLSDEQYKKFIANKAENRKMMREHLQAKE